MSLLTTIGGTVGGAVGGAVGAPQLGAAAGAGAAKKAEDKGGGGCCGGGCCCGDSQKEKEQKEKIAQEHPYTGDAEVDKKIEEYREAEFKKWQQAKDITQFEQLPPALQEQLPEAKKEIDQVVATLPKEDLKLTLTEFMKKYPTQAKQIYDRICTNFLGIPADQIPNYDFIVASAKASGFMDNTLEDLLNRFNKVAAVEIPKIEAKRQEAVVKKATAGVGTLAVGLLVYGLWRKFRG